MPKNISPSLEILELKSNLAIVKSAMGVATYHEYLILSSPTVCDWALFIVASSQQ